MNIFQLLIAIPSLGVLGYGAIRLKTELKDVRLGTVSGVLVAMISLTRYMVYAGVVAMSLFFILSLVFAGAPPPPLYQHPFRIQFMEAAYSVSDIAGLPSELTSIKDLRGNVNVVGASWVVSTLTIIAFGGILYLLNWILIYGEKVLRSLAERDPFTEENVLYTKRISMAMLCLWFIYSIFQVVMGIYLQSQLQLEGVKLEMISIPIFDSLFIIGLVYVLGEVFRVGFELKKDQSFTV